MKTLTSEEIQKAFELWSPSFQFHDVDKQLAPFLEDKLRAYKGPGESWLKNCREAQLLSGAAVAKRLKSSRASYAAYEDSERAGKISLETLAKTAEAMDCELVYVIRPKLKKSFGLSIWAKLLSKARNHGWLTKCDQKKRAQALSAIAKRLAADSKFRKEMNWSAHKN